MCFIILGTRNTSLVTASQAIFLGNGQKRAPVAVVGVQFKHDIFVERFFNTTGTVGTMVEEMFITFIKYKHFQ